VQAQELVLAVEERRSSADEVGPVGAVEREGEGAL